MILYIILYPDNGACWTYSFSKVTTLSRLLLGDSSHYFCKQYCPPGYSNIFNPLSFCNTERQWFHMQKAAGHMVPENQKSDSWNVKLMFIKQQKGDFQEEESFFPSSGDCQVIKMQLNTNFLRIIGNFSKFLILERFLTFNNYC